MDVVNLGVVEYREAWDLQRSIAADVADGTRPDTLLFLEHPRTITLGRRSEPGELHVPEGADVAIVEVDRGGSRPTTRPASSSATRSSTSRATGRTFASTAGTWKGPSQKRLQRFR